MYTGPQRPDGGRGRVLLYGGIAFALVFLLIVGAAVAFLVVRDLTAASGDPTDPTTSETVSASTSSTTGTTSSSPVDPEYCWAPDSIDRVSENPDGRLRGGHLQYVPPALFSARDNGTAWAYTDDPQRALAPVEGTENWASSITIGSIHWQDGIEYPGAEDASRTLLDCLVGAGIWDGTSGRTLVDEVHEPVTIDGVDGWKATGTLTFAESDIPGITHTAIFVYVLDTPGGPSFFAGAIADESPGHEAAFVEAVGSLEAVG